MKLKNQQATCDDTGDQQSGNHPAHSLRLDTCSRSWRRSPHARHVSVSHQLYLPKYFPRDTSPYTRFHLCFLIAFPVPGRFHFPLFAPTSLSKTRHQCIYFGVAFSLFLLFAYFQMFSYLWIHHNRDQDGSSNVWASWTVISIHSHPFLEEECYSVEELGIPVCSQTVSSFLYCSQLSNKRERKGFGWAS